MPKESYFKKLRDVFLPKEEIDINESVESPEPSFPEPEVESASSVSITPAVVEGTAETAASFFIESPVHRRQDNELKPVRDPARLEHEPYRFNENGDMKVCVTKANLYEIHPKTKAVKVHPLDKEVIEVQSNCVVCSYFETDTQGNVTSSYQLKVEEGENAPDSVHFELPDEDGSGGVEGSYYIPLFWVVDGELERNNYEGPSRTAKLWGGIQGHRGPVWWARGYNKLYNVGGGKNVYKQYVRSFDQKELRTIKERAREDLSSPFSGDAQVRVRYEGEGGEDFDKSDSEAILVHGNEYDTQWYVGSRRMGIVEDGLVTCLSNLPVKTIEVTTLSPTTVASVSSETTSVLTSSTTANVVGNVTYSDVAGLPTTDNSEAALTGLTLDSNFWAGGSALPAAGLNVYEVQLCGTTGCGEGKSVYVMGTSSSTYAWPSIIVGAAQTSAATSATQDTFLQSVPAASVVTGSTETEVVSSTISSDVLLPAGTVNVYEADGTGDKKFLTAANSESETQLNVVVESAFDGCTGS